jgi:hypothetical protein
MKTHENKALVIAQHLEHGSLGFLCEECNRFFAGYQDETSRLRIARTHTTRLHPKANRDKFIAERIKFFGAPGETPVDFSVPTLEEPSVAQENVE